MMPDVMMEKMTRYGRAALLLLLASMMLLPATAEAGRAMTKRFSLNQSGDITLIGNVSMTCPTSAACTTTLAGGSGTDDRNDSYSMVMLDADSDSSTFNSSAAVLSIPAGSTVQYAGLYWSGFSSDAARSQVLFKTPSAFGYSTVTAGILDTETFGNSSKPGYQGVADVTTQVRAAGSGTYWIGNVQANTGTGNYAGWSLVVVYTNSALSLRNLTVFDGFVEVASSTVNLPVSGFLTPLSGPVNTKLGVISYEGDRPATGDTFSLNGTQLTDSNNPVSNFFNSTFSNIGTAVSSSTPNYYNNMQMDIDLINVPTTVIGNGATSATISVTSPNSGDENFLLGVATFVTDLYVPIITPNIVKTATDVNGGSLVAGDTLRWTVTMTNTGLDTATNLTVTDPLPAEVTYAPGTLKITSTVNNGSKTDAAGDDVAEYISGSKSVVFRLGSGATSTAGGSLAYGETATFTFDTIVNSGLPAGTPINNSVNVSYRGQTIGETYAGAGAAASAVLLGPPAIAKSFAPTTIDVNGVSVLSIVVSNPAANPSSLSGVTFTDTYPSGLVNAASPNALISCTSGSTAGTLTGGGAGAGSVGMSGATIAPNGNCTVTVNVTSSAAGSYSNTTSTVTSSNGGSGPAATAAVLAVGKPSISKAFSPTSITAGSASTITFTITNPSAVARTGVAFTDTLSNMVVATPTVTGGTCTGTRTAVAGSSSISFSGGSLAASGSCTVTVSVTSSSGGVWPNTSTGVSSTETGAAGNPSNTAYLTVVVPPVISKSFNPTSVRTNSPSQMTITVSNPNTTTAITGIAFTDTYPTTPGAMINDTPPNSTLNCTGSTGGTVEGRVGTGSWGTVAAAQTAIRMTGLTLAAGGSCTVTVNVDGPSSGDYVNSTGAVTSTNAGTGNTASATLNITNLTAPTVTKTFGATSIAAGATTTLTISFSNSNTGTAGIISGLAFTDTFPYGLVIAPTPGLTSTCGSGVTAVAGGTSLSLSGGSIPQRTSGGGGVNGTCSVTVNVTSAIGGAYTNTTGTITTSNAGTFGPASASLNVLQPATMEKYFTPSAIAVTGTSTMTIKVTAPLGNPVNLTGVAFTDNYTTQGSINGTAIDFMRNAAAGSSSCTSGSSMTLTGGANNGSTTGMSGGTLAPGGTCTITVSVDRKDNTIGAGTYTNSTGAVTSTNGGTGLAVTGTLSLAQPSISKSFGTSPIVAGATSRLSIVLTNPVGTPMTAASFTDTYPATTGMVNTSSPGVTTSAGCGSPTVTAVAGAGSISVSGATIPASGTCTIAVNVTANTTAQNIIAAGALTATLSGSSVSNGAAASATLQVYPRPQIEKVFSPATVLPNADSTMTVTLTNTYSLAASTVAFTDTYPSGLINGTPANLVNNCGGTATASNGGTSLSLSGASIPANSTCTITVSVRSATAGEYSNTISNLSSSNLGNGDPTTAVLTVMAAPTVAKSFSPGNVLVNEVSVLTITLTNSNTTTAVTGTALTDTYPSGIVNDSTPNATTSCPGGSVSATAGGNSVGISGASIPANGSCTMTVRVKSATAGSYANRITTVSTTNAGSRTDATNGIANATLTVTLPQPSLGLLKLMSVLSDPVNGGTNPKSIPGAISTYTIRLTNSGPGTVDANPAAPTTPTFVVSDPLPTQVDLYVGDIGTAGSGPFVFTNGSPASGLTCTYTSLASTTDCVEFSTNGTAWTATPTPDANGFDSAIRYIRFRPSGSMNAASGGNPYAEFQFRVRVK